MQYALPYNDQLPDENREDNIKKQESVISQRSKHLPKSGNSYFRFGFLRERPKSFQADCECIADLWYM